MVYIVVQDYSISSALAMEILQSYTQPVIWLFMLSIPRSVFYVVSQIMGVDSQLMKTNIIHIRSSVTVKNLPEINLENGHLVRPKTAFNGWFGARLWHLKCVGLALNHWSGESLTSHECHGISNQATQLFTQQLVIVKLIQRKQEISAIQALCEEVTNGFPSQKASSAESVLMSWCHHNKAKDNFQWLD